MRSYLLLAASAAVVLLASSVEAKVCKAYESCKTCTESKAGACGWCGGECVSGGPNGPQVAGACNSSTYHWHEMTCPATDVCSQYTDCDSCGSSPNCGFCNGKCSNGTSSGPTSGSCGNSPWHFAGNGCPTPPPTPHPRTLCATITACEKCTKSLFFDCGWCDGQCWEGSASGPKYGSCNGSKWEAPGQTCPTESPGPHCGQYKSCHDCTYLASPAVCGWCDGECKLGNEPGPTAPGKCHGHHWHWEGAHCPTSPPTPVPPVPATPAPPAVDCAQYMSCHDCTFDPSSNACGWCDNKCQRGTHAGPTNGTCGHSAWHWEGAHCPTPPPTPQPPTPAPPVPPTCASYLTCTQCTRDAVSEACGWCNGMCRSGNVSGPFAGGAVCNHTAWHWEGDHCPPSPPTPRPASSCTHLLTCGSCVILGFGGCGWCDGQCHMGNSTAPERAGVCHGKTWLHGPNSCPLHCSRHTNCFDCATGSGCGWCDSTQKCSPGNSAGPGSATCPAHDWHYEGNHCPTPAPPPADCSQYKTCNACAFNPENVCGFCSYTRECVRGTRHGPTNGTCAGQWQWGNCPLTRVGPNNN